MNKILIISGTHGNEMSAVELGLNLVQLYKNNPNVDIIPFLNLPGIKKNTREVKVETSLDLNRSFEVQEDIITYSEIVSELKTKIQNYDIVIDIHNSWRCSNFFLLDEGKNSEFIIPILNHLNILHASRYSKGKTIKDYANKIGALGMTYEFSGMTTLNNQKEILKAFQDITKLVSYFNDEQNNIQSTQSNQSNQLLNLYVLEEGFIKVHADINTTIKPKEVIFEIINEQGISTNIINNHSTDIIIMDINHSYATSGSLVAQYIKI